MGLVEAKVEIKNFQIPEDGDVSLHSPKPATLTPSDKITINAMLHRSRSAFSSTAKENVAKASISPTTSLPRHVDFHVPGIFLTDVLPGGHRSSAPSQCLFQWSSLGEPPRPTKRLRRGVASTRRPGTIASPWLCHDPSRSDPNHDSSPSFDVS